MENQIETPDYEKAKEEAIKIINIYGIKEPPINPINFMEKLGIGLKFFSSSNLGSKYKYKTLDYDILSNTISHHTELLPEYQNLSGIFDFDTNTIYVNTDYSANRQAFTIAHELGHSLLHKNLYPRKESSFIRNTLMIGNVSKEDKEANCFAAELLVPTIFLKEYKKKYPLITTKELSKVFAVSQDVITYRLSYIKYI